MNDYSLKAKKLMLNCANEYGQNGIAPADCGRQYEPHMLRIVKAYNEGGNDAAIIEIEGLQETCPPLYAIYCADPEPEPIFKPLSFTELMARPEKEWLIDNVLGKGDLAMIFGEAGSGKTFIVIDLIFAAILDKQWAASFSIPKPLTVAYCAGEGISGLKARFAAQANKHNIDGQVLGKQLIVFTEAPQLFLEDEEFEETIDKFIVEYKADNTHPLDLLILDTLHAHSYGAEENSAKDTGLIIAAVKRVIKELGCTVLLVHHANKSGNYRGSSALHGACDLILEVKRGNDSSGPQMTCYKLKDAEPFSPIEFRLETEPHSQSVYPVWQPAADVKQNGKSKIKDKILSFLKQFPGKRFTAKAVGENIGKSQQVANNHLVKLFESGEVKRQLQQPNEDSSSRNPMVYWVEAELVGHS